MKPELTEEGLSPSLSSTSAPCGTKKGMMLMLPALFGFVSSEEEDYQVGYNLFTGVIQTCQICFRNTFLIIF